MVCLIGLAGPIWLCSIGNQPSLNKKWRKHSCDRVCTCITCIEPTMQPVYMTKVHNPAFDAAVTMHGRKNCVFQQWPLMLGSIPTWQHLIWLTNHCLPTNHVEFLYIPSF